MDNEAKKKLEDIKNGLGVIAEMSLLFFRAALGAGATFNEAQVLTQAYIAALTYGKRNEGNGDG